MKKTLKKLSALVLALAMIVAMSATAFAANSDGDVNIDNGIDSTDVTINIAKQIVFVNAEDTTVREPNITYTYTISAVTPTEATITDKDDITGTVKAGILSAVKGAATDTTSTVAFTDSATSAATANGTSTASKYAAFTFTASAFNAPGIYRYKISETASPAKASVGITEAAEYNAARYLDVYVKWNDDAHTTLAVYGYVLFEGTDSQTIKSAQLTPPGDVSMKSAGYVNTSATAGTQEDVDVYTTQNLYINKTTTGSLADKNNDFPIAVTLTAPSGVSNVKLDVTTTGSGSLTTATDTIGAHVAAWGNVAGTVRDGSQIAIKGVPAGASVSIVETNNTADSYKVKAGTAADGADILTEAIVAAGANAAATSAQTLNAKVEIYFTNTLEAISPTGVVLRFGPYALMLGAGLALLILAMRRKSRKNED